MPQELDPHVVGEPGVVTSTITFSPAKTELTLAFISDPLTVIIKFACAETASTVKFNNEAPVPHANHTMKVVR
jgi:hypothetical protein